MLHFSSARFIPSENSIAFLDSLALFVFFCFGVSFLFTTVTIRIDTVPHRPNIPMGPYGNNCHWPKSTNNRRHRYKFVHTSDRSVQ